MKIAVVSEDGKAVSQHFGRAPYYVVVTVEGGKVIGSETRSKAGHHVVGGNHATEHTGQPHGFDAASQATHASMVASITDCEVLLAGGMGWGAQQSLRSAGIETVVTEVQDINQAVKLYLAGNRPNRAERLH